MPGPKVGTVRLNRRFRYGVVFPAAPAPSNAGSSGSNLKVTFLATEGPKFRTISSATSDKIPGRISAIITGRVRSRLSCLRETRVHMATTAAVTVAIDAVAAQVVVGLAQCRDARSPTITNRVPTPAAPALMALTTRFDGSSTMATSVLRPCEVDRRPLERHRHVVVHALAV